MPGFTTWLIAQRHRDDSTGDFGRHAFEARAMGVNDVPRGNGGLRAWERILAARRTSIATWNSLYRAHREWQRVTLLRRLRDLDDAAVGQPAGGAHIPLADIVVTVRRGDEVVQYGGRR